MSWRPAFVGILNDFENLAMLALNKKALLAETPQTLRQCAMERPEVNSWATNMCWVPCYKSCPATGTHTRRFYFSRHIPVKIAFIFRETKPCSALKENESSSPSMSIKRKQWRRTGAESLILFLWQQRQALLCQQILLFVFSSRSDNTMRSGPLSARNNTWAARETLRGSGAQEMQM